MKHRATKAFMAIADEAGTALGIVNASQPDREMKVNQGSKKSRKSNGIHTLPLSATNGNGKDHTTASLNDITTFDVGTYAALRQTAPAAADVAGSDTGNGGRDCQPDGVGVVARTPRIERTDRTLTECRMKH
jgi:hypothetical protein